MAKNIIKPIFDFKNQLDDSYQAAAPNIFNVKTFDLERKHLVYGRIDRQGNAIYLDDSVLEPIPGVGTHWAPDFVRDAFLDFKRRYKTAANSGVIDKNSLYRASLKVHKAWEYGDLSFKYNEHINNLYANFVGEYLSLSRRHENIKNFKDFVKEFTRYLLRIAYYFPFTKTGYILSAHCSPFASGLMVEVASEQHGMQNKESIEKYMNDPNFTFFVNEARKYGFMVDKNAPWRIVFNIFSGALEKNNSLTGAQKYMNKYAVSAENVFQFYYRKAHLEELVNIQNMMLSFYESFYLQYSTYEVVKHVTDETGRCNQTVPHSERKERELPPTIDISGKRIDPLSMKYAQQDFDEYWLKLILKLRMVETKYPHDNYNFNFYIKEVISRYRNFGAPSALNYINDLTKGASETKFLRRGEYWYGTTQAEYENKKRQAKEDAINPLNIDYALTGVKNIK